MNVELSKRMLDDLRNNYVSFEYILREILPSVGDISKREIPPMFIDDDKEKVEISEEVIKEIRSIFPTEWKVEECCEYLLILGVLMEV